MSKYQNRLGYLGLVKEPVYEKKKSEFKLVIFSTKIGFVLHPASSKGFQCIHT